tara:strand:+ start:144 stop:692 length:549 start_codon:yes stop_codon:yes gene_type:complete
LDIKALLFSLLTNNAEFYLTTESKNSNCKKILSDRAESEIEKAIGKFAKEKQAVSNTNKISCNNKTENNIEATLEQQDSADVRDRKIEMKSETNGYFTAFHNILDEVKSVVKSAYGAIVGYSKYLTRVKKKIKPDCWQIGMDVSSVANFIFFPKKMKKITGIMIDKGIMLDYINPAPAYCNF